MWPPIPRLWPYSRIAILASGPSLSDDDVELLHCYWLMDAKLKVLTINSTWKKARWADGLFAADAEWWKDPESAPRPGDFDGLMVTTSVGVRDKAPWVHYIPADHKTPLMSWDPNLLHRGSHSLFQAINLSIHLGGKQLILLGADMQLGPNGEVHHHGAHKNLRNPTAASFSAWRKTLSAAAPGIRTRGIDVVNCSRQTALDCFRRAPLEQTLEDRLP